MSAAGKTPEQDAGFAIEQEDRSEQIERAFFELRGRIAEVGGLQKCVLKTASLLDLGNPRRQDLEAVVSGLYGIDRFLDSIEAYADYIEGLCGLAFPDPAPHFGNDPLATAAPPRAE